MQRRGMERSKEGRKKRKSGGVGMWRNREIKTERKRKGGGCLQGERKKR